MRECYQPLGYKIHKALQEAGPTKWYDQDYFNSSYNGFPPVSLYPGEVRRGKDPESFPMSQFLASGGQSIGVSASASVLPMKIPGLIFFRIDWLNLLAVQGTLKSLLQHHSSKPSILQHSAFFILQLSYPYMTTGKTITLTFDLCWQSNVSAF